MSSFYATSRAACCRSPRAMRRPWCTRCARCSAAHAARRPPTSPPPKNHLCPSPPSFSPPRAPPPADIAALEELLVRISDFVLRHADRIEELELNPVWVGAKGQGAIPLDALIIERTGAAA